MQRKKTHRFMAALLALVMVLGLMPTVAFARSAGDDGSVEMNEAYAAHESLTPVGPSFNIDTLLEWTPESDPDAAYSRSSIPLKHRTGGFVVNPKANPEAKLMLCSMANTDFDNASTQGSEDFFSYAFNYWQYTDSFVYWSGSEEGLVVCPTGDFIDAAHTNGVPVVATLGFPWGPGSGYVEQVRAFVQKNADGTFPVADKLIEVMDYYGFDGYFFNQESYGCSATEGQLIDEMMRYMHKQRPDMLISWYDSMLPSGGVSYQDAVNDSNKQFMTPSADGTRAIDQFFMNYNWYQSEVDTTVRTMESIGRSPFDAFAGFNVQANVYGDRLRDHLLVDADGIARLSLALYYANQSLSLASNGEEFHETERSYYVGAAGDPRDTSVDVTDPYETAWAGMSRFFADKTPILEAPFVTDFNTGHGKAYFVDGQMSRQTPWSYQSNQDVLPTWTWIVDSQGEKLSGGYDFSTAWNGGNSVKFHGNLTAGKSNDIMLYSTNVAVKNGMELGLTYKGDQGLMKLVAYYGDKSTKSYDTCQQVAYDLTAGDGGWVTTEVDISEAAGKTLYAIGLQIQSSQDVTDYQVNLGRLTIIDRARDVLTGPTGFALEEILYTDAYTAEARVSWNPISNAASYEIYKVHADGSKSLIMETPNTAYYIPTLTRETDETDVTLEVVPVNRNGVRGAGTELTIDWAYGNEDSEKVVIADFENLCLNATVTAYSEQGDGAECSKALDGTSANGSKWWASGAGDWFSIDLGEPKTVRRWRVEHAEAGGEDKSLNTDTFTLAYKNDAGEWVDAKKISGNTDAVTDVLLDTPITAQEWKLTINRCGPSPWTAVNIYEWQMFESDQFPQTTPVAMHFAKAVNQAGATDRFTLEKVPAGQTVKVYTKSADGYTEIASAVASGSTVTLENLDFGTAEAGRVYYTTTATGAGESAKLSAPFEAENAEKSAPAEAVSFQKFSQKGSTTSSNGADIYTTMTVTGLNPGDVVYIYENGAEAGYTKASLPVAAGETSVTLKGVRVVRAGGALPMQVKRTGKLISDLYTVETPQFPEPTATLTIFAANENGETLTGVIFGVYNEAGERVIGISTTSDSGGRAELPLGTYTIRCEEVPEGYALCEDTTKQLRAEGQVYELHLEILPYDGLTLEKAIAALNAHYQELLDANIYSDQGKEALAQALAQGLEALELCATEAQRVEALAAAMAAMDAVPTRAQELEALQAAVEAAKKAAEEARRIAEEARAAAEAALAAAQEAAGEAAQDMAAAEKARQEAEAAQKAAEEAEAAALTAQAAAEAAAKAAEESNLAAAKEAEKAALDASTAALSAASAAEHARAAAEAQKGAQTAQAAAEAAQAKAEAAQKAAEEAKAAAEAAAKTAGEDSAQAKQAREQAEAAQKAAQETQKAAENAQKAAQAAREAAEAHDEAAAASAAEAAKYALEAATKYEEICAMKLEMAQYLLEAQKALLASTKYYALLTIATYADKRDYAEAQQAELAAAIEAGTKAVTEAESVPEVEKALSDTKAAIDAIKTLAEMEAEKLPFTDVAEGKWYYESVKYVYQNGLFRGVTETTFAPNATMDRAMMITVLYRLAGEPEVEGATAFTDVNKDGYYYDALLWATRNGIVKGITETTFAPKASITREQMVTFLYRYAQYAKLDVTKTTELKDFADAGNVSKFAEAPMAWAVAQGIVVGDKTEGGIILNPKTTATRAQVATVLMRLEDLA